MKIYHAIALLFLSTFALGAEVTQGSACGFGSYSPPIATTVTPPPMSIVPIMCGMATVWLCNVDPGAAAVSRPYPTAPCGVELCGADEPAAVAAATALLRGAPGVPQCAAVGFATVDKSKLTAVAASWDGTCLKPAGPPCVPLVTLDAVINAPSTVLCDLAPTSADRVCCKSPQTGVPYLCRPLPAPNPSEVGKGLCAIDTLADSTSKCTDSVQCYPGACYPDTCFCAAVGEPCASTSACCDSPSAAAACIGGTCEWTN